MADPFSWAAIASAGIGAETAATGLTLAEAAGTMTTGASLLAPATPAAFTLPSLVPVASIGSSVAGAFQQRNAGIAQDIAAKQQAVQEGIRARDEGIVRREKLLNTLASQNARVGASGITGMTPKNVALTDIQNFRDEQDMADLGSSLSQRNSKAQGANARSASKLGAGLSLIDGYLDMKKIG